MDKWLDGWKNTGNKMLGNSFLIKLPVFVMLTWSCWITGSSQDIPKEISENNIQNYREELHIQTDRDLYIVGEQVWLKVFKLNAITKKPNNISKVVYIELLNRSGYPVQQIKLSVDKKSGSSGFSLSDTLGSDNYLLRAYTNWMKNFNEKLFAFKTISVLNPFQSREKTEIPSDFKTTNSTGLKPDDGIMFKVTFDKLKYGTREKVKVNISATNKNGNPAETDLTLSIAKSCLMHKDRTSFSGPDTISKNTDKANPAEFRYMPELKGNIINGILKDYTTNKPLKNIEIVFSVVGQGAKCQFFKSNESGNFYFLMNETGLQQIVIQTFKADLNDYYVELNPDFISSVNHSLPGPFYPDTSKLEALNKSIISMQIENLYQPYRQSYQRVKAIPDTISFYGEPVYSVKLSDFIQLTTVREVIKEIVPYVTTRKKAGKFYFQLLSVANSIVLEKNPLVLVDGTPFYDIGQILDMRSSGVEQIDVLNQRYFFDEQVFDGILHFITKKGSLDNLELDQSAFRQAYAGFQSKVKFISPMYNTESLKNSRIPDFRNTLYWNPDLHTQKNGTATFEFYTSDEEGDYILSIEIGRASCRERV